MWNDEHFLWQDPTPSLTSEDTPVVFVVDASVRLSLEPLIRRAGCQPYTLASGSEFLSHPRGTARAACCWKRCCPISKASICSSNSPIGASACRPSS